MGVWYFLFVPHTSLFDRKEGWSVSCYPCWASNHTLGELVAGTSKWSPVPRLLGAGWWPGGALH